MISEEIILKTNDKLESALKVACEVQRLAKNIVERVSTNLQERNEVFGLRDRVLVGFVLKIYRSFECLADDSLKKRIETTHHLKTMVEAFIYFHWVSNDQSEVRAKLVLAEACDKKKAFFRKNPNSADPKILHAWSTSFDQFTEGLEAEWKNFKKSNPKNRRGLRKLAEESGPELSGWYERVYSFACEPAHVTDLSDHMPKVNGYFDLTQPQTGLLQAYIALGFGLHIILNLMKNASEYYKLNLDQNINKLETRFNEIWNRSS